LLLTAEKREGLQYEREADTDAGTAFYTRKIAEQKVRKAEDGWKSRNPQKVALAYTIDSQWRNRAEFATGRESIINFLTRKWQRELDYRLNGTMIQATGIVPTATRIGSSTLPGSCIIATHASTTCRSRSQIENTIGCSGRDPKTIRDYLNLGYKFQG
jgi:hypothetical protein